MRERTIRSGQGAAEPSHVPGHHVVRVEQRFVTRPATEDRIACVAGVVEDRADSAALPSVREPVTVLLRPHGRRAWDALAVEFRPGEAGLAVAHENAERIPRP